MGILWWINHNLKNAKAHRRNKKDEVSIAYYTGYERALIEIKDKAIKIIKEDEEINNMQKQNLIDISYKNYKNILIALNNSDEAKAKAICIREMNIIDEDSFIENDEEGKIIELADVENHN